MNRPCNNAVICPAGPANTSLEGDDPVTNFSSEAIDGITFTGVFWPIQDPWDTFIPGTDNAPPIPCVSSVSQDDADLCSIRNNPPGGGNPTPPGIPGPTLVGNKAQTCAFECPDGTAFFWTVPPGSFLATNEATADQQAAAYACEQGLLNAVCISATSTTGCLGQDFECDLGVTGGYAPYGITLLAGQLPPGFGFVQTSSNTAVITGLASTPGTFSVVVQARDSHGNVQAKTLNIVILAIANASIVPLPVEGQFYEFQLQGTGGAPPYTFSDAVGLPANIELFSNGTLFGEAFVPVPPSFSCTLTDANGVSCDFNVTYKAQACPQFNGLVWPNPPTQFAPPGNGNPYFFNQTFPTANSVEWNAGCTALGVAPWGIVASSNSNTIFLPNSGSTCKCTITVNSSSGSNFYQVQILDPTLTFIYFDTGVVPSPAPGTTVLTINIPVGVTKVVAFLNMQFGAVVIQESGGMDIVVAFS